MEPPATVQTVSIGDLKATQPGLLTGGDAALTEGPPLVVKKGGELFVRDGHHRLARMIEAGADTADVRVVDLDAGGLLGVETASAAPASIRAYHGSPYDFDQFDISKIGTGEGAQMYGRGLYFAESPDVARSYRDELTEVPFEYQVDGKPVSEMYNDALKNEDYELAEVLEQVQLHDTPTDLKQRFTTEAGYSQKTEDYVKGLDYDNIKGFDPDGNEVPLGRQYEVEIAADPEMMLDYQSPLVDQPKAVQDAYKSIFFDKYQRDDVLSELFPTVDDLDMQSVGLLGRSTGGQAYKTLASTLGSEQAANEALLKAGIPGIKYLDLGSRFGAKSLKDATSNYVIFDDDDINILRKYGLLAPLVGGGTAAAVMGADEPQPAGGIL